MALPPHISSEHSPDLPSLSLTTNPNNLGVTGGSLSKSRSTADRPPTLSFPTLHLGSFNTLTVDSFPSPPASARSPNTSTLTSPDRPGEDWARDSRDHLSSVSPGPYQRDGIHGIERRVSRGEEEQQQLSSSLYPTRSRESSRGSLSNRGLIPPQLPPPTTGLPPLPILSPISPLSSLSPLGANFGSSYPPQNMNRSNSNSPAVLAPPISPAHRPVGATLTMNIPPSSPYSSEKNDGETTAVLKSSVGIPRRRTLVDAKRDDRVTEVRLSKVLGAIEASPKEKGSPESKRKQESSDQDPFSMAPHRLEKKPSTQNLRESPTSPAARRTLPRPPISDPPSFDSPLKAGPSNPPQLQPAPTLTQRTSNRPAQTPLASFQSQQQSQPSQQQQQQQLQPAQHRPTNSASALPIIAGLADAGPYPSSRPTSIKGQQGTIGRGQGPRPPPQEEICLECMMRDRDLADVTVIGDDAWERASNEAWEESKRREVELLRSLSSVEDGSDLGEGSGPASHPETLEEGQRTLSTGQQAQNLRRARRAEKDQRVIREIGWRGFKWEEGSSGEGLPRSFRGTVGGRLTEEAIKAVMTKFPSASAHRYNWLQSYLRHQYMLTVELANEAKRIGYFPAPVEIVYSSSTSHEAYMPGLRATGSRTSSLTWDATQPLRQPVEYTPRSAAYPSSPATMPQSLVRPSPSSPADLAMGGRPPRAIPIPRPTTHFIPDREPNPNPPRQKLGVQTSNYNSTSLMPSPGMGGLGSRDRWGGSPDPGDDEQWPPISPAESGMRPFSFAVRAGATGGERGSDSGHGRRSIFGRWGGSVTSFFGGSQGGSGSMMDMHLGLDSDRRNQASSAYVHTAPRAVSLASPTPPAFFRSASSDNKVHSADRTGRSMSNSRLSQVLGPEENEPVPTTKKEKGFKGLLQKMKPKSRKSGSGVPTRESSPASTSSPYRAQYPQQPQQQRSAQLQPPPSLNYLVGGRGDGNGQHSRNQSGSSSSMITDSQDPRPNSTTQPSGARSVSAPFLGSTSTGSPNISPTSSRFDKNGNNNGVGKRGSYASLSIRPGSGYEADLARESIVEVLSGQGQREVGSMLPRRQSEDRYESSGTGNGGQGGYGLRPHNKTTSSLSASSVVETPPPHSQSHLYVNSTMANNGPYFGNQSGLRSSGHQKTPSDQLSPNRFKTLPPLPPPSNDPPSLEAPIPYQHQQQQNSPRNQPQHRPVQDDTSRIPRTSYDPAPTSRSREGDYNQPSPRLAQSMYAQPTGAAFAASFGSYAAGQRGQRHTEYNQDAYGGMMQSNSSGGGEWGRPSPGGGGDGQRYGDYSQQQPQQGGWRGDEGGSQGKGTAGRKGLKALFGKSGRA